jgi:Ca2+-binding RTX toxin-like protein
VLLLTAILGASVLPVMSASADHHEGTIDVNVAPVATGDVVLIDAYDVVSGTRYIADDYPVVVAAGTDEDAPRFPPTAQTQFSALPVGDYKVRVRIYDATDPGCGGVLYEWYTDQRSYRDATPVTVTGGGITSIGILADVAMGCFDGDFYEFDTGNPITAMNATEGAVCITAYEDGGPMVGFIVHNTASGAYEIQPSVPAGRYRALAYDCSESDRAYLDAWYSGSHPVTGLRGPSGALIDGFLPWWPDPAQALRARPFFVPPGGTVTGIDGILPLVPDCNGSTPTVIGTSLRDVLLGTPGDDVILALAGNDIVYGYEGDDTICLGPGNDRAFAADGRDTVIGGTGVDRMFGGLSHDTLIGNGGDDVARGGAGADLMLGGPGDDVLQGAAGVPDEAHGNAGTDTCFAEVRGATCELP